MTRSTICLLSRARDGGIGITRRRTARIGFTWQTDKQQSKNSYSSYDKFRCVIFFHANGYVKGSYSYFGTRFFKFI